MAAAPPVLAMRGVTLGYGAGPVVRDLSLEIASGEILAMLGANGAGKSTTLGALAGFIDPIDGRIEFEGEPIAGSRPQVMAQLGIAHVPEGRGVFHGLTVAEHFRLNGNDGGIDRAVEYFPALADLSKRRAGLLSGGEQQMLALACALCRDPRVLLIDELSLGLAPIIVENLLQVVRRHAGEAGCAVLIVEQHVHLALGVADRAIVLSHGQTVLEGSATDLDKNRDVLVASYLGASALPGAG